MDQRQALRGHRLGHDIGGLFLFVDFAAVGHDGAVGEVDHLLRQAASKEAGEPVMTTAPDDDQIAQAILGY